jgi:hypothetical protein
MLTYPLVQGRRRVVQQAGAVQVSSSWSALASAASIWANWLV